MEREDSVLEVIKFGHDLGSTFLLTGMIAGVIWLQENYNPGIAAVFLIVGGFIMMYTVWLKRRNQPKKEGDCPEELLREEHLP